MFNKKKLTNLRSVRSTCENDLQLLEATIASLVNSNSNLREENAKLNAEVSVLESNYNNLQADLNAYDDIIGNLNLTIEDLRAQVTTLTNDKNKLQADLNAANATISSLNSQINSLNSQVTTLTNDNRKLSDMNLRLENDLASANATISSLNSQINSLNSKVTTLTADKNKLQADLNTANTTITSLNSQINSLNSQVTTLTADKNKLQNDLNSITRFKDIAFGPSEASYNSGTVLFDLGIDGKGFYGGEFIGSDGIRGNIDGIHTGFYCNIFYNGMKIMYLQITGLRRFGSNGKFYLEFSLSNKSDLFDNNKVKVVLYDKEFIKQNNELASVVRFFAGLPQAKFA